MRLFPLLFTFLFISIVSLQAQNPTPSSPKELANAVEKQAQLRSQSTLNEYGARNIGPVVQGGRITDLEVDPRQSKSFFVAYASGGLFLTEDNGISFTPVFDNQGALGIGDIALSAANPDVIWVGTGENNSSRSSYAGAGMYKSTDGGKTWTQKGLIETHHIGRIVTHPTDVNTAWVGSMGALYSQNEGRGVYKTTNGGTTWKKNLFVDDNSGIIDLVIHPTDPNLLWAASWERFRQAWNFEEGGKGSAIWKSTDGGETWNKSVTGFPQGNFVGRIGLDISRSNPNVLYALLDNQFEQEDKEEELSEEEILFRSLATKPLNDFLALPDSSIEKMLKKKGFPKKYIVKRIRADLTDANYSLKDIATYFGDANEALFNTKVTGAELYRSDNGGNSWKKVNSYDLEGMYFTYGYYFGQVRVSPDTPDRVYTIGYPLLRSEDGGKTFSRLDTFKIHVDHHAFWIDPADPDHLILGNDGGLYISYDRGGNWLHLNNLPVGQFYTVNVDNEKNYNVYGGLQDNGVLAGSSKSQPNRTPFWERIFGGDGMFVNPDPRNSKVVITGFQFGNYYRINRATNDYQKITPVHDIGQPTYRFNWRTPVVLSPHHPDIVYFGSQYLHLSMDQGDTWTTLSGDLTHNHEQGNVPYSTLTTIDESPLHFGQIWTGTDDGNIHLTTDMGNTWQKVSGSLPQNLWVSRVFASPHDRATAFVSLNGYRFDDFSTYVYKTTDYGATWQSLKANLPEDVVNTVIQDPQNPNLLYLGQDHGTFVSLNGGQSWELLGSLPNVSSYDMIVHPREDELVVATHGRSMYVVDVKPLQTIAGERVADVLYVFDPVKLKYNKKWGEASRPYYEPKEPALSLMYYCGTGGEKVEITVKNADDKKVHSWEAEAGKGFHSTTWNLRVDKDKKDKKEYLGPGEYSIAVKLGKELTEVQWVIEE